MAEAHDLVKDTVVKVIKANSAKLYGNTGSRAINNLTLLEARTLCSNFMIFNDASAMFAVTNALQVAAVYDPSTEVMTIVDEEAFRSHISGI